jgi:aminoglycoside phosphotransferase (APT) family kinase protein
MRHARGHGYPVPEVLEVTAEALVLEKVDGPTMWQAATEDPFTVPAHAESLARLHRQLHEIVAPDGLAAVGEGDRLVHLDLHPANVILSPAGPVVIDWTNARSGEPAFDVAVTWVIGATSTGLGSLGRLFVDRFLPHFERGELRAALRAAAEYRLADANVTDEERQAVRELMAREGV